jgi:hypothetical protein
LVGRTCTYFDTQGGERRVDVQFRHHKLGTLVRVQEWPRVRTTPLPCSYDIDARLLALEM